MQRIVLTDSVKKYRINIGKSGEHDVETIVFDVSEYITAHGVMTATLVFESPKSETFPVAITQSTDKKTVTWVIKEDVTATPGFAIAQLVLTGENNLKISTAIMCEIYKGIQTVDSSKIPLSYITAIETKIEELEPDAIYKITYKWDSTIEKYITDQKYSDIMAAVDNGKVLFLKIQNDLCNVGSASLTSSGYYEITFSYMYEWNYQFRRALYTLTRISSGYMEVATTQTVLAKSSDIPSLTGYTKNADADDSTTVLGSLKESLTKIYTATSGDEGKALKAKTVANGQVTEWEFGEAGSGSGGLTTRTKNAILACFNNVAWKNENGMQYYNELATALSLESEGGGGTTRNLVSISAIFNGESATAGTKATDLDISVTGTYSDGTTSELYTYTISGTVAVGVNTFTISASGKTCTLAVTGTPIDTSPVCSPYGTIYVAGSGTYPKKMSEPDSESGSSYGCAVAMIDLKPYGIDATANTSSLKTFVCMIADPNGYVTKLSPLGQVLAFADDGTYVDYGNLTTLIQTGNEFEKKLNALGYTKLGFNLMKGGEEDSYIYIKSTGDILFAGENTKYYGMKNISEYTGD